ncbi:YfiR family protein [Bacteroidota bacterium]
MVTRFFFAVSLIIICSYSYSQFDDMSRAEYIFDIVKYVKWENEEVIDTFKIVVLDTSTQLYLKLKEEAAEKKSIHSKPVKVLLLDEISQITDVSVIYMNRMRGYDINEILSIIRGRNILLITENYEYQKSMINFIEIQGKKKFEINERRMNQEGMTVSPLFMALGVNQKLTGRNCIYR